LTRGRVCSRIHQELALTGYKSGKRVSRRFLLPALIFLTLVPGPGGAGFFQRASDPSGFSRLELVGHALRERVGLETPGASRVCGEAVLAPDLLRLFYAQRESRPAWSGEAEISSQVRSLLQALKNVFGEGLDPSEYHLIAIEEQSNRIEKALRKKRPLPPEILAEFDMLCSDAFLSCAAHLLRGKVDPETHRAAWQGACLEEGLAGLMERALMEDGVAEALSSLAPRHSFYLNLKKALASYRRLAQKTEWTPFSEGLTLQRGDKRKVRTEAARLGEFDDGEKPARVPTQHRSSPPLSNPPHLNPAIEAPT
jgi:murein L,D-transpeptidase YcbB/YkuD